MTIIVFVGSVFSPYYAWARRRGGGTADPQNHCAVNVALYSPGGGASRWTLTERGRRRLERSAHHLRIGPSSLGWDGTTLTVDIDERGAPLPFPVRGQVRVRPAALTRQDFVLDVPPLDDDGRSARHRWWPIAPCSRVEVSMQTPALSWSGPGYLDMNAGDEPLEQGFRDWDWSRADLDGDTVIFYDPRGYDGSNRSIALRITPTGEIEPLTAPPRATLPTTSVWRIPRAARGEPDTPPSLLRTLEDTPFYARSVIRTGALGRPITAIHESLLLTRFAAPWVQMLLPFRMPRIP